MIARRTMIQVLGNFAVSFFLGLLVTTPASAAEDRIVGSKRVVPNAPLADDYRVIWKSPLPGRIPGGTPGGTILPGGRLIATFQINSTSKEVPNLREDRWGHWVGRIFSSDDHGDTWQHRADFPFKGARPIVAGKSLYVVGKLDGLRLIRSDDGGRTWSDPVQITDEEEWQWYSQACSVVQAHGRVYFVMDRVTMNDRTKGRGEYAPVVISAKIGDDWTRRDAWQFSNELTFNDVVEKHGAPSGMGFPFYAYGNHGQGDRFGRPMGPMGWFESNLVRIHDPEHIWHDPRGRTFHILMRAQTGATNVAGLLKAVEGADGTLVVSVERAPSGEPIFLLPFPGGQNRFHVTYDEKTKLYWLLGLQTTDSMKRVELLNPKRWGLPKDERHRLALHFSKNLIDWCFAGLVANAGDDGQSRHYGPLIIDGDDLQIICRSAGPAAANAHNADMITSHTVRRFRELVY